jgi:hypothetical protein
MNVEKPLVNWEFLVPIHTVLISRFHAAMLSLLSRLNASFPTSIKDMIDQAPFGLPKVTGPLKQCYPSGNYNVVHLPIILQAISAKKRSLGVDKDKEKYAEHIRR